MRDREVIDAELRLLAAVRRVLIALALGIAAGGYRASRGRAKEGWMPIVLCAVAAVLILVNANDKGMPDMPAAPAPAVAAPAPAPAIAPPAPAVAPAAVPVVAPPIVCGPDAYIGPNRFYCADVGGGGPMPVAANAPAPAAPPPHLTR
jgi:hypothetical protein